MKTKRKKDKEDTVDNRICHCPGEVSLEKSTKPPAIYQNRGRFHWLTCTKCGKVQVGDIPVG